MNDCPGCFGTVAKAVNSANALAHLDPASFWALATIACIAFIIYTLRQSKKSNDTASQIRVEDAKANTQMANAMQSMAEKLGHIEIMMLKGDSNDQVVKKTT